MIKNRAIETLKIEAAAVENLIARVDEEFVAAVGIDGLFLEVHDNPAEALSDGANMILLDNLENLLKNVLAIHEVTKNLVR